MTAEARSAAADYVARFGEPDADEATQIRAKLVEAGVGLPESPEEIAARRAALARLTDSWGKAGGPVTGYWDPLPVIRESAGVVVEPILTAPQKPVMLPEPSEYLRGTWEELNWRNVPGPLYGAMTDSCWCGRLFAPESVCYNDGFGEEFVYRQPRSRAETYRLLQAAWADPFSGYAMDGDEHWTPESVRDWWGERAKLREWTAKVATEWASSEREDETEAAQGLRDFLHYQDTELETDLRGYVFWLSERRVPGEGEALPTLT